MTDPSSQASGRVWRDAVRSAAAQHFPALRPVFLVSRCTDLAPDCAELEQQLGREHSQLGDILSPDLLDGHRRLGYKVRLTRLQKQDCFYRRSWPGWAGPPPTAPLCPGWARLTTMWC